MSWSQVSNILNSDDNKYIVNMKTSKTSMCCICNQLKEEWILVFWVLVHFTYNRSTSSYCISIGFYAILCYSSLYKKNTVLLKPYIFIILICNNVVNISRRIDADLAEQCRDADLIVIEGMGRYNYNNTVLWLNRTDFVCIVSAKPLKWIQYIGFLYTLVITKTSRDHG